MYTYWKNSSLLDFLDLSYDECYTSSYETCSNDYFLEKFENHKMTGDECIKYCQEDSKCKFVSYATKNNGLKLCRKYQSCGNIRKGDKLATTYSKDGNCPGVMIY